MEVIKEALTFDDVLLVPKYSSVLPSETNLNIVLGKNLKLLNKADFSIVSRITL